MFYTMLVQIPNLISSVATDSNKLTFLLDSVNPYQLKDYSYLTPALQIRYGSRDPNILSDSEPFNQVNSEL